MALLPPRFVKVTSGFVLGGGRPNAKEGDVLELPFTFAREMVAANKAVFCDPPPSEVVPAELPKAEKPKAK